MTSVPGATVTRSQEIGLQLPDGTQIFPPDVWHGRPLSTPEEREGILAAIRTAAKSLGYPVDELMATFAWATREKITAVVYEDGGTFPIHVTGVVAEFADDYEGAHPLISSEPLFNGEATVQTPS